MRSEKTSFRPNRGRKIPPRYEDVPLKFYDLVVLRRVTLNHTNDDNMILLLVFTDLRLTIHLLYFQKFDNYFQSELSCQFIGISREYVL